MLTHGCGRQFESAKLPPAAQPLTGSLERGAFQRHRPNHAVMIGFTKSSYHCRSGPRLAGHLFCCGGSARGWPLAPDAHRQRDPAVGITGQVAHVASPALVPRRPGEFHPEPLRDPDINLSGGRSAPRRYGNRRERRPRQSDAFAQRAVDPRQRHISLFADATELAALAPDVINPGTVASAQFRLDSALRTCSLLDGVLR